MFALSKFEWLVLAVALLLCPGLPWVADPQPGEGASAAAASLFDRLDRNRDGYLSREELASDEARRRIQPGRRPVSRAATQRRRRRQPAFETGIVVPQILLA